MMKCTDSKVYQSEQHQSEEMEPGDVSEKSEKMDQPPAYNTDMGYPPAPAIYPTGPGVVPLQGGYPAVQGFVSYGAQPYPSQATVTVQPTVFVTPAPQMHLVPDYLGYSIFTMLCCCLPLGIAALIYSINTRDANLTGNRELALRNSQISRLLNHIALGLGIVSIIFFIVMATTVWKTVKYN